MATIGVCVFRCVNFGWRTFLFLEEKNDKKAVLKRILLVALILTAITILFTLTTAAETEGYYTYSISNGEATITEVDTSISGDMTIPSTLGGYPVTSIGDYAFGWCDSLTSITIPDSVTSIGDDAFYNCYCLTNVRIGNRVESIGYGAFNGCTSLTSVTIPDSAISIGGNAFYGCTSLTSVTIPDGVTSIGVYTFYGCSDLTSVTIPDSVTSIEAGAFLSCNSLTSVRIGNRVESIGYGAFNGCTSLTSVTIPDGVTSIGDYAFYSCYSLTSVTIPDSVTSIGMYAFRYCDKLETITLLSPTTTIYNSGNGHNSYTMYTIPSAATIFGFAGSTADTYALFYNRSFVPFASDLTTVFEFNAIFEADAEKSGVYSPIATLNRTGNGGTVAFDFLYVDGASVTLYIKDEVGVYQPLYGSDNNLLMLGEDATPIAVIYDNVNRLVRYYINNSLPRYGENKALAYDLAVSKDFCGTVAITDVLTTLDGVDFTNAYTINESGTAEIVALQENTEDSCSTRILAGVDMLYYGAVGFETELYIDNLAQNKTPEQSGVVYSSVIADTKTVLPSDYGFRYFATLTIEDVDLSDYSGLAVHLIIKPYTQVGTTKYYGSPAKVDITENEGEYLYAFDESYVG